jgi:phenylpropionate dioxygenase-like ring-hydroxylating dioxygenase large terminal subunit
MLWNLFILASLYTVWTTGALSPVFKSWNCIGTKAQFFTDKPNVWNMGDLPMALWKEGDEWLSRPNVCSHMGSRLDTGCVLPTGGLSTQQATGSLQCPYHGLRYGKNESLGSVIEFQDKLFWSWRPEQELPDAVPGYGEPGFDSLVFEYEMPCSLPDAAYNAMDLHHPEFVHQNLLGFGSSVPPTNIQFHRYTEDPKKVGLSFDYVSAGASAMVSRGGSRETNNFHLFRFPGFTWSRVSFGKTNELIIGVHFLPVGPKKTKWFVSVAQNYLQRWQRPLIMAMALSILNQDRDQMLRQAPENGLKADLLFQRIIPDEEVLDTMRPWFRDEYVYPDLEQARLLLREAGMTKKC